MKRVFQTKYGVTEGNCFMACVASLLEVSVEAVVDLHEATAGYTAEAHWFDVARDWLREHHAVELLPILPDAAGQLRPPRGYSIVGGHCRMGTMHACVALDGRIVHDPHPTGLGVGQPTDYCVLVPLCVDWTA